MQQWLDLVPMVGALLNLSAAMTNLAITIINRRGTTSASTTTSHANHVPSRCHANLHKASSKPHRQSGHRQEDTTSGAPGDECRLPP